MPALTVFYFSERSKKNSCVNSSNRFAVALTISEMKGSKGEST
jgi:hypothetical protein